MAKAQVEVLFYKVSHSLARPWEMWMSEECIDIRFICLYIQIAYYNTVKNWDKPIVFAPPNPPPSSSRGRGSVT